MPTPDKTIDVSKLISEARELADSEECRDCRCAPCTCGRREKLALMVPQLADALESVAKENAESEQELELVQTSFNNLLRDHKSLRAELAAVAKELDALREAISATIEDLDAIDDDYVGNGHLARHASKRAR